MGVTVEDAKEWLKSYGYLQNDIDSAIERLCELDSRGKSPRTSQLDGMPHGSRISSDRYAEAMAHKEDLEKEISYKISLSRELYHQIEDAICRISGSGWPDKRAALRMRYLDGCTWGKINKMLFGQKEGFEEREETFLRRVHRVHVNALEALAELLSYEDLTRNDSKGWRTGNECV